MAVNLKKNIFLDIILHHNENMKNIPNNFYLENTNNEYESERNMRARQQTDSVVSLNTT